MPISSPVIVSPRRRGKWRFSHVERGPRGGAALGREPVTTTAKLQALFGVVNCDGPNQEATVKLLTIAILLLGISVPTTASPTLSTLFSFDGPTSGFGSGGLIF